MVLYEIELVGGKGHQWLEGKLTLTDTKIKAIKFVGKGNATAYIHKTDKQGIRSVEGYLYYDPSDSYSSQFYPGWYYQSYVGEHKRTRVSPKTGKALNVSRYYKYV